MIRNNNSYSLTLVGALLVLPISSHAGSLTFHVGAGEVSFNKDLKTSALTAKGYIINSYSQSDVDENSLSLSVSLPVTPKVSVELGLQKMGEVKSSLDITLPSGISAAKAAKDINDASPQQLGGLTGVLGLTTFSL